MLASPQSVTQLPHASVTEGLGERGLQFFIGVKSFGIKEAKINRAEETFPDSGTDAIEADELTGEQGGDAIRGVLKAEVTGRAKSLDEKGIRIPGIAKTFRVARG